MDRRIWIVGGLALAVGVLSGGAPARAQAPGGRPPFAGGPGGPALSGKWADRAKQVDALIARQQKAPKDAKLKSQTVKDSYALGHELMVTQELPPYKYRFSLKYLRAAAKLDPGHKQAKADIDQIESIYKSMGRPVPQ
jgi:hypothetical protein